MKTMPARVESQDERYAEDLARLHSRLRYGGLSSAIVGPPICRIEGLDDDLTTIGVWERQLPERYLRAVLGFRLAQFLRTGLMDRELARRQAMFHEPVGTAKGVETIHVITLTGEGRIVGYMGLTGSQDPEPLPLDSAARTAFPVEVAHRVDLLSQYAARCRTTHSVVEIKRFVRDSSLPPGKQRNRIPWHLILACMKVGVALDHLRVVVGDASERGALRHLRLLGLDLRVVEGTTPWLARTELMWPSYEVPVEKRAKPFAALLPANLDEVARTLELTVAGRNTGSQRALVSALGGPAGMRGQG